MKKSTELVSFHERHRPLPPRSGMNAYLKFLLSLMFAGCCCSRMAAGDATNAPAGKLSVVKTLNTKTTFKILRRRPDNNRWDKGQAYASTNGIALIKALEKSKPWDGQHFAAAYGWCALPPGLTIVLDWSHTKAEQKTHSVTLCYGNRLFWYGDDLYEIPAASYKVVDKLFPKNK